LKDWVIVYTGDELEAAAATAALEAAGIEALSQADGSNLPGVYNLRVAVDVAVPRRFALEASHVLRTELRPEEVWSEKPRSRRAWLAAGRCW
jgi:hypothetical protein